MLSIPCDPVPQPQNTSGGAFQQSTQDHKMYYRANFWIDKEVPCATLRGEDGCIIVACCILHNLTVNLREPEPEDCDMDGGEIGSAVRKHIAYNFFQYLHRDIVCSVEMLKHTLAKIAKMLTFIVA